MTRTTAAIALPRRESNERRLLRTLASRCHGSTAVVDAGGTWSADLEDWLNRPLHQLETAASPADARGFKTVVVFLPDDTPREVWNAELDRAWSHVRRGGRMLVTAPNGECASRDRDQAVVRRDLRASLRRFGHPVTATGQPYAWLVMHVRRSTSGRAKRHHAREDRYRATARLCRGRVLELGCGEGGLVEAVVARGLDAVGIDMNAAKIATARERCPGATFLQGDILQLDPAFDRFDTVVIAEVLEHVTDEVGDRMLDLAWSRLVPSGRLIVSVPNENLIPHPNHIRQFDRRGLARILRRFGRPRLCADQPFKWLMMYVDGAEQ